MYEKLKFGFYSILFFFNFLQTSTSNEARQPLIGDAGEMSEIYDKNKLQTDIDLDLDRTKKIYYETVLSCSAAKLNGVLQTDYKYLENKNEKYIQAIKDVTKSLNTALTPGNKAEEAIENKMNSIQKEFNKRACCCIKLPPYFFNKDQLDMDVDELKILLEQRFEAVVDFDIRNPIFEVVGNSDIGWQTYRNNSNETV